MHLFPERIQIHGKKEILGKTSKELEAEVIIEKAPNHFHNAHHQAFHRSLVSHLKELVPQEALQLVKAQQLLENLSEHQLDSRTTFALPGMAKIQKSSWSHM